MKHLDEIMYAFDKNVDADFWMRALREYIANIVSEKDEECRNKVEVLRAGEIDDQSYIPEEIIKYNGSKLEMLDFLINSMK